MSYSARILDWGMCTMMDLIQRRHRLTLHAPRDWRIYVDEHRGSPRDAYFQAPRAMAGDYTLLARQHTVLRWSSPFLTPWVENNQVHVDYYLGPGGTNAPTVLLLHALMSASDIGYRRWAQRFHERGWNACFLHLPYHYSRKPAWRMNGELAITADCVRTAEGLRQGVAEARQLLALLRHHGCNEFALWGTSYGGWIGALLLSVESGFRWASLMAPIVDVGHAIWHSPAGSATRRELRRVGMSEEHIAEHLPLVSPLHATPLDASAPMLLYAGTHDRIVEAADVERLHHAWQGSTITHVDQGHFGYAMMRRSWEDVVRLGLL